jgi:hypothetical protein
MALIPDTTPRADAMHLAAEMARRGLHDLTPYPDPDTGHRIDPLTRPDVQAEARRFLAQLWGEADAIWRGVKP